MMYAIYNGKLYDVGDDLGAVKLSEVATGKKIEVSYSDPALIIDPTDDQINNILPDEAP